MTQPDYRRVRDAQLSVGADESAASAGWEYTNVRDSSIRPEEKCTLSRQIRKSGNGWEVFSIKRRDSDGRQMNGRSKYKRFHIDAVEAAKEHGYSTKEAFQLAHQLHGLGVFSGPRASDVEQYITASDTQRAIAYAGDTFDIYIETADGLQKEFTVTDDNSGSSESSMRGIHLSDSDGRTYWALIDNNSRDREWGDPVLVNTDGYFFRLTKGIDEAADLENSTEITHASWTHDECRVGKYGVITDWGWE